MAPLKVILAKRVSSCRCKLIAPRQDEVRARGNELQAALQELRQVVFDILTSQTVRRFVINSFLVCAFATFTYYLSIPAYAAFYHFYLPDQIVTVPLHLQYGFVSVSPCPAPRYGN